MLSDSCKRCDHVGKPIHRIQKASGSALSFHISYECMGCHGKTAFLPQKEAISSYNAGCIVLDAAIPLCTKNTKLPIEEEVQLPPGV